MGEADAGLRGDVGEHRLMPGGGCDQDAGPGLPRATTTSPLPSASLHVPVNGAFVIVDRLPLVVIFGLIARRRSVIACEDSSALKRRKSCSSRSAVAAHRPGRGSTSISV